MICELGNYIIKCYNVFMKNWSIDTTELTKDMDKYAVWKLEQLINFGLGKEKIKIANLRKYWNVIDVDPAKRTFLKLFV